jgi:hypothetical protein
LRWQQGANGSRDAGACWVTALTVWESIAQREQADLAGEATELQSANPSAGAKNTAKSSPEAINLRNCMDRLYHEEAQ